MALAPGARRRRAAVLAAWVSLGVAAPGCDGAVETAGGTVLPPLVVTAVTPATLLPGGRLRVRAGGLLPAGVASYLARVEGAVEGSPVAFEAPARLIGSEVLELDADLALFAGLAAPGGVFEGRVDVQRTIDEQQDWSGFPVSISLAHRATPQLATVGDGEALYPGDRVAVVGDGLLLAGEGTTLVRLDGAFAPDGGAPQDIVGLMVPLEPDDPDLRTAGSFALTADVFGVRPGQFSGAARLVAVHGDGVAVESAPLALGPLVLRRPVITEVTPGALSRGQRLTVRGRGLLPPDPLQQAVTVLLFEGLFTPRRGEVLAYEGVDALSFYPEAWEGNRAAVVVLRSVAGEGGGLEGLGARAGRFEGRVTPLVLSGADLVAGDPFPVVLEVGNARQLVYLRYLPGFDDALTAFGLGVERDAVRARVLEVLARDYAGVNITFTADAPDDFAEYAVVEIGGQDPNGSHLFGLDNTSGKDTGNLRLDDVIGGFNAETRARNYAAYGGIFVTELLNFSPTLASTELASPRFDELFGPVTPALGGEPAALGEAGRFDARAAALRKAVRVLGNLIGSTITHEIGHTLGLTAIEGRIHNEGDNPGWIMDAGSYRPFAERAEIDGQGPAVFAPFNRAYLLSVLPPDP